MVLFERSCRGAEAQQRPRARGGPELRLESLRSVKTPNAGRQIEILVGAAALVEAEASLEFDPRAEAFEGSFH